MHTTKIVNVMRCILTSKFTLQGLCCSSCATKIEQSINNVDGVVNATVSLATSNLKIETQGDIYKTLYKIVVDTVKKHDPNITIYDETKDNITKNVSLLKITWLTISTLIFIIVMILHYGFYINPLLTISIFGVTYILLGYKVILRMFQNIISGNIFDENFLMGIATLGAIAINKLPEAVAVLLFYQIGEFFQQMAVSKSKKRISDLMDIQQDYVNIIANGKETKVDPKSVKIDDVFLVKPYEKIPLDGIMVKGESIIDTTALTGESIPQNVKIGDNILSGCINQNGLITIRATKTFSQSTVNKILDLVENAADKKSQVETFITKFAKYYTPAVVLFALLLATIPPLFFNGLWGEWIYRALIFLIVSCPCALVLSIPMGFFGGIGSASKRGILIKGGNFLEALSNIDTIVFDKTGTLTKGTFIVTEIVPVDNNTSKEDILKYATYAENFSNHPIALSITKKYKEVFKSKNLNEITNYEEIPGHGVIVHVNNDKIVAGNEKLMRKMGINFAESNVIGTKVYIALNNKYIGHLIVTDEIKSDINNLTKNLKKLGVRKTIMLTGDKENIAKNIANKLNLDEFYANLLPQDKVNKLEYIKQNITKNKTCAYVGDGINDAPVLAFSDVGISMGALGSDAAIEASDVVIMTDDPNKILEAMQIARFTKRIVWQNIIMTLSVQFLFLYLATFGISSLWEAVFADVGVALIAVLNSMRVLGHVTHTKL